MKYKKWVVRDSDPDQAAKLSRSLGLSPVVARVLVARGLTDLEAVKKYLSPNLLDSHDPFGLSTMERAVKRIQHAIRSDERITIHGDYDVDGATSTALFSLFFRSVEANFNWFIPNRMTDGYGLTLANIERIAAEGTTLVITCDNGITAFDEIARAAELGVDVIVCDHHEPLPGDLPVAHTIVNPKLPNETYPARDLAAVGVSYKVVTALIERMGLGRKKTPEFNALLGDLLALVAIGTVADVVPLVGENRILASLGCLAIAGSASPGLKALREVSRINDGPVEAWHIGFQMAPRLNAGGRMGDSTLATRLLTCESYEEATEIAETLDKENIKRRAVEQEIQEQANAQFKTLYGDQPPHGIVLGGAGWHKGVIGIVAQRVGESWYRPAAIIGCEGNEARGSLRSVPGLNLIEVLDECSDMLQRYGGHAAAAGLELPCDQIDRFRERFNDAVKKRLTDDLLIPTLRIDAEEDLDTMTLEVARKIKEMAPFGRSNPHPIFCSHNLQVVGAPRTMGRMGRHLQLHVRQNGAGMRVVAFNQGDRVDAFHRGDRVSIAYKLKINDWRGTQEVELEAQEIRPANA